MGHEFDALVSQSARARLLQVGEAINLPARTVCLECRLADTDDRVDFALCLASHTAELRSALEGLGQSYQASAQWQRCIELLARWAKGEDPVLAGVPFLYTAFDLTTPACLLPVPCLSLCADPSFFMRRVGLPVRRAARDWPVRLLDTCTTILGLETLRTELGTRTAYVLSAGDDIEVRQLSLMLSRDPIRVKFDLTLPLHQLERFLVLTGHGQDVANTTAQLRYFAPWQQRVQLNYVIAQTDNPTPLEFEFCCTGADEGTSAERQGLLKKLVSCSLASQSKVDALQEILDRPTVTDDDGHWSARNWYLKVSFEAGKPTSAKAYVGIMQRSTEHASKGLPTGR